MAEIPEATNAAVPTPKVFISYSWTPDGDRWTTDEHKEWVLTLATRLENAGVKVILDRWDLKYGQDKYVFMEQMVTDPTVTKVLAVCDRAYARKADERSGGVGTESQIISNEVYKQVGQEKFVAVLRERNEDSSECLPRFFTNRKYFDFTDDESFEESFDQLVRALYDRPELKRPPRGTPPAAIFREDSPTISTTADFLRFREAAKKEKKNATVLLGDYLDTFLKAFDDFIIKYDPDAKTDWDETVIANLNSFTSYRDQFIDAVLTVAKYQNADDAYDKLFDFLEAALPYQREPYRTGSFYDISTDNFSFILHELFLYLIVALIKEKRFEAAARFIEAPYQHREQRGGSKFVTSGSAKFRHWSKTLEKMRKDRLGLRVFSVAGDLLKIRATHSSVLFSELCQADMILFIRDRFPKQGFSVGWYPTLANYCDRDSALELFVRATTDRGFKGLGTLLRVNSRAELMRHLNLILNDSTFQQSLSSEMRLHVYLPTLFNIKGLEDSLRS